MAPTAVCVRAGEHEYTPLPLSTNSTVIHGEVCAHTPPSGRPQRLLCACPRQHTPHSCARGWTFKTCPLTPPRAAPMARSGRPGDAEPCCYPLLRKRFSGYVALVPAMPTHAGHRGVCACALLLGPRPPRVFLPSPRHQGVSSLPRPHATAGPQTGAHRLPRSPASRARSRSSCELPSVCLAPRQDWRPMAAPAFVSSGSPGSECAGSWDTPLPGSSQPSLLYPSALMSLRRSSQWLSRNSARLLGLPGSNLKKPETPLQAPSGVDRTGLASRSRTPRPSVLRRGTRRGVPRKRSAPPPQGPRGSSL